MTKFCWHDGATAAFTCPKGSGSSWGRQQRQHFGAKHQLRTMLNGKNARQRCSRRKMGPRLRSTSRSLIGRLLLQSIPRDHALVIRRQILSNWKMHSYNLTEISPVFSCSTFFGTSTWIFSVHGGHQLIAGCQKVIFSRLMARSGSKK
jgi:hypothetical protein